MPASSQTIACWSWCRTATGRSGRCCDYVVSTVAHLEQMGIVDGPLHALARRLIIARPSAGLLDQPVGSALEPLPELGHERLAVEARLDRLQELHDDPAGPLEEAAPAPEQAGVVATGTTGRPSSR